MSSKFRLERGTQSVSNRGYVASAWPCPRFLNRPASTVWSHHLVSKAVLGDDTSFVGYRRPWSSVLSQLSGSLPKSQWIKEVSFWTQDLLSDLISWHSRLFPWTRTSSVRAENLPVAFVVNIVLKFSNMEEGWAGPTVSMRGLALSRFSDHYYSALLLCGS